MNFISEKTKENVKKLLGESKTIAEIARIEKISRFSVRKILRKANLRNVVKEDLIHTDSLNLDFFKKIDTEEKAYFLGLLYADGCVHLPTKCKTLVISLALQEADKEMVEKFRNIVAPKNNITITKSHNKNHQNLYSLKMVSNIIGNQLILLGCMQRKSLILQFPSDIVVPISLQKHFIRGYFDGDGCISYYFPKKKDGNENYKKFSINITSSNKFCEILNGKIFSILNIIFSVEKKKNGKTTSITLGGNRQVLKFMRWIYEDATVYMQRKYDKYLELEKFMEAYL